MTSVMASIASAVPVVISWIEPICSAISSVALAVCPASDFTSAATTANPLPDSPARAASIVAFKASRLVCPAIAWMSPTTSPIRVAAAPSCDIVVTVRCASETARPATSVDFAACEAISPIEAASSSTELAAAVTFSEAAVTRLVAVSASEDTVSAALLRSDELISSFIDAPRSLPSALSTECLNCEIVDPMTSLRCSRARPASLCICARCSRSIMLSRNTMTVRAIFVACAGRGDARRGIAVCETRHDPRESVQWPRDAAPDKPAEAESQCHHADADNDNAVARAALRCGQLLPGVFGGLARVPNDVVGARQHVLTVNVDDRMQRSNFVVALDPSAECLGVGFHHLLERSLRFRCGVDWPDDIGEGLVGLLKLQASDFAFGDAEVGLMVPHIQKCHHQLVGVGFRQPGHVIIDNALDGVARHLQPATQAG